MDAKLLTVEQAAEALGISRAKTYQLLQSGQLESLHLGRSRRIAVFALDQLIARAAERELAGVRPDTKNRRG